ncbi:unnamed protein product [Bursaphelenchus xylophilus]|uniref:(pine wood nematode) hypothetical protein n=1 Tax=Bursaphelenchus xylophilus TaxID=6326 RepID=A0A1I7S0P9_BURXY|nr:unnamed protein product [Bursaphelenchus xylophilus]CAG9088231.1 unnamed protein product [Bursaphelenchus xylophilus]
MESVYSRIDSGEYCEQTLLLAWDVTALLERGKFLPLLYNWTTKKFGCSTNVTVSRKSKNIAVLTPDGELSILFVKDGKLVVKSQVRVLLDPYPEFRLIEFNNSESLLFATRSNAIVDVFEANGMFLYKIPLSEDNLAGSSSSQIVTQIRSISLEDDAHFSDDLFTLQIDGTFSAFRVGRDGYHKLFSMALDEPPVCDFVYIPKFHLIISSSEYQRRLQSEEEMDCTMFGLNVYRHLNDFPFIDCLKKGSVKKAWHEKIPFLSHKRTVMTSMEVSPDQKTLIAISSIGDVIWFDLPSLRIRRFASAEQNDITARPMEVRWTDEDEVVILHSNGQMTRAKPADYFDGTTVDPPLHRLDYCKHIRLVEDRTIFALTEARTDAIPIARKENNKKRVGVEFTLFLWFYIAFIAKLVKAMFASFFGGNPNEEMSEKIGVEQSAQLALYATRNITLADYIEIQLAKHEYQVAIDLAKQSNGTYDLDLVYKRQWSDFKKSGEKVTLDHLKVLHNVQDTEWLVRECLHFTNKATLNHHLLLIQLAKREIETRELTDEILSQQVDNAEIVIEVLAHTQKHEDEALEIYLRHRDSTLYTFAFAMAEETEFEILEVLFQRHRKELRGYLLVLLAAIPESTQPRLYSKFLPAMDPTESPDQLFYLNTDEEFEAPESHRIPPKFDEYGEFLYTKEADEVELTKKWFETRIFAMDTLSGLPDDIISLVEIAIQNGFEEIADLGREFSLYADFVRFTAAVHLNFAQLKQWNVKKATEHLTKHLSRTDLLENFERVVELIEFIDDGRGEMQAELMKLVKANCKQDFALLSAVKTVKPEYLTNDSLIECFYESEVRGAELTDAMKKFNLGPGLIEVVQLCNQMPATESPTFAQIHSASREKSKAFELCQKFIQSAVKVEKPSETHQKTADPTRIAEWWRELLFRARRLRSAAFENLLPEDQILNLILNEMIESAVQDLNPEPKPYLRAPFHLVVDLNGTAESAKMSLLKQSTFEQILCEKSKEFIENAQPNLADPNLIRADLVLQCLLSGKRAQRRILNQQKTLEMVRTSIKMGSQRPPITFIYCDKQIILTETVSIGDNYKEIKRCAELAKHLDLPTPAATALAACAAAALEKRDHRILRQYVRELAKKARDFPVVYKMAKKLIEDGEIEMDQELRADAIACLIHNCPEDELTNVFEVLKNVSGPNEDIEHEEDVEEEIGFPDFPDPSYSSFLATERYFRNFYQQHSQKAIAGKHTPIALSLPKTSIQFDIVLGLEGDPQALKRIQNSKETRELFDAAQFLQNESPSIIQWLPLNYWRQIAARSFGRLRRPVRKEEWSSVDGEEGTELKEEVDEKAEELQNALERVLVTGCDRERFFEDPQYREDTLTGLALTTDQDTIKDVELVANNFRTPLWPIYMAYLDYLLTDEEVKFTDAKKLLLRRSDIQEVLFSHPDELRQHLRQKVVPLIDPDDIERLSLVETYFP